jgi:hypothetical protein
MLIVNFFVVHCSTRGQNVCVAASQPGCGLLFDRRGLQRRFNRLSDMMVDVNKQRMIDNQTYVKHILQLAVEAIDSPVL